MKLNFDRLNVLYRAREERVITYKNGRLFNDDDFPYSLELFEYTRSEFNSGKNKYSLLFFKSKNKSRNSARHLFRVVYWTMHDFIDEYLTQDGYSKIQISANRNGCPIPFYIDKFIEKYDYEYIWDEEDDKDQNFMMKSTFIYHKKKRKKLKC